MTMDDNTKRGGTVPDAGACAPLMPLPTPSSPFGAFGNPLDALRQQAFSLRDMSYRQQGPPMERLKARQKDLEQERAQLTDKLNKIDAAIVTEHRT
jgi:hypothetical protein